MNMEKQILEILKDFETFKLTKDEQGVYAHTNSYKPFVERIKALILNSSSLPLKDKNTKEFEEWLLKGDYERIGNSYVYRRYGNCYDKTQLRKLYN